MKDLIKVKVRQIYINKRSKKWKLFITADVTDIEKV